MTPAILPRASNRRPLPNDLKAEHEAYRRCLGNGVTTAWGHSRLEVLSIIMARQNDVVGSLEKKEVGGM